MAKIYILAIFVIIFWPIAHMGSNYVDYQEGGKVGRTCAYIYLTCRITAISVAAIVYIIGAVFKVIYFDSVHLEVKYYIDNYKMQLYIMVAVWIITEIILFSRKIMELMKKFPHGLDFVVTWNGVIHIITYYVTNLFLIIVLPDSLTNNVLFMHNMQCFICIPASIIVSIFVFRYNYRGLKNALIQLEERKSGHRSSQS